MPEFNAMTSEGVEITRFQYWVLSLSLAQRDSLNILIFSLCIVKTCKK